MVQLSVILPVFNVERYIGRCLRSILGQTQSGFELIVVNDASTDASLQVAQTLLTAQDRIPFTIIEHERNRGLSAARNTGLQAVAGAYVIFLDSDDHIEPRMLEYLMGAANSEDADIVGCHLRPVDEAGRALPGAETSTGLRKVVSGRQALLELFRGERKAHICKHLFRRPLFDRVRFPEGQVYEDLMTMPYLLMEAEKVVFLDEVLYNYLQRTGSVSRSFDPVIRKNVSTVAGMEEALRAKWADMSWQRDFLTFKYGNIYNISFVASLYAAGYKGVREVLHTCRSAILFHELRQLYTGESRRTLYLLWLLWGSPWAFFHCIHLFFKK